VADWAQALRQVALPGRQHLLPNQVNTLLDVAHNPQAVRLLADYLHSQQLSGRIHAVFAALNDKDIVGLIAPMQALVSQWYVVALSGPRAVNGRELGKVLMQRGVSCDNIIYCQEATQGYRTAMQNALPGDWVVVYGSFLTVAPVLAMQPKRKSHEIGNE
jgi:dihydrofolate synthase/folylpolyglutamate synthase